MPDSIGEAIMLMVQRIAQQRNFRGYRFVEDMKAEATLLCLKRAHSFDLAKSTNGFAYLTQIITNSMIRTIRVEKTSMYVNMLAGETTAFTHQRFCREQNQEHEGFQNWKLAKVKSKPQKLGPSEAVSYRAG